MAVRSRVGAKAPTTLWLPPPILRRRYALEGHTIGQGGCARVYRAWDARQGTAVVVKQARVHHKGPDLLVHEAEMLAALDHPGIPTFLEYFEEAGRCYLVESWCAGTPMSAWGVCSLPRVIWIGLRCCEILSYLHQRGVVHRDLAPGNVVLADDHLCLLDFGLASAWATSTAQEGTPLPVSPARCAGSPGYAAPEQWDGVISPTNDLFGLGMLLGCALTAVPPEEVCHAHSFTDLWEDPARIPAEERPLLDLLDRMILRAPGERPLLGEVRHTFARLERSLVRA